jgi:glucans biosynthesis protein
MDLAPLVNPKRLLVTSFGEESPKGFGLMQRQRRFEAYQDFSTRYSAHPSAWVEPIGAWGPGRIELVQIPAPDETNDNIVAYWISDAAPAPKQPIDLHYRVHWQKDDESRPPTAWITETLRGKGYSPKPDSSLGFVIDYAGPMLDALPANAPIGLDVSTDANGTIVGKSVRRNPDTGGARVELHFTRKDDTKPLELRVALRNGTMVSETWSYALPPG